MSKKKRSRNESDLMKMVRQKDDDKNNLDPNVMMKQAYRSGRLSQAEWQSWLDSVSFCERYK